MALYLFNGLTAKGIKVDHLQKDWGVLNRVALGEEGRGRKLLSLPCPEDLESLNCGMAQNLAIVLSKTGRPCIKYRAASPLCLLISTEGGYTRRGDGVIEVPAAQHHDAFTILGEGNGADGDAGRIGTWKCMALQVNSSDCWLKLWLGGYNYGYEPRYLHIVHNSIVTLLKGNDELLDYIDQEDFPWYPFSHDLKNTEWTGLHS